MKTTLLVAALVAATAAGHAADRDPLTLKHAYELAAQRSERMDIQAEEIEQARARYRQTRGSVLPNIRFNVSTTIQDTSGTRSGGEGVQQTLTRRERTESKFTFRQPIFQGFKEFAALKSLKADEKRQQLLFQREATLLFQDVAAAFFEVLGAETRLADLRTLMKLSESRIEELRERTNLGKSRGSEITTAESQYAKYRADEAALLGDIAVARADLSFLIGEELGDLPLADVIPDPASVPPLDELIARISGRSDIAALREEVAARKSGVAVARAGFWPSLSASGNYYVRRPPGFQREIDWDALFALDVPLYQGGGIRALYDESKSLLRQAESGLSRLLRFAETDVRGQHAVLSSSISEAGLLEDAAAKARRSYELLSREYRMGLANNLDVLQAMNDYQTIKRDYDLARLQAKLDLINLRLAAEMAPENLP